MASFEEQYNRLNADQKKAVDTLEGPVLVIAGPGTGKTQVLALRIANIRRQTDANPSSILCLTFQDASVIAMKSRLQSFIGNEAFKVQVHTFHSFCSDVIRSFPTEFEFTGEVEAVKDIDKLEIFKQILLDNKLTSLQMRNDILGNFKNIVSAISNLKKEFVNPQKFGFIIDAYEATLDPKVRKLEQRKLEKMRDLKTFYEKYVEYMKTENKMDFDDMIFKVTEAFSTNDELVKFFQEQYLYTLVDEFQDTNASQLEVIRSVGSFEGLEANVFAVGDEDQTIFRFQGASSDNFEKFLNIFPGSEVIVLHTNYRSGQEVIDCATSVIENNPKRLNELEYFTSKGLDKNFKSGLSTKSDTQVHSFEHSFHEDYWIGTKIQELTAGGTALKEIAVIARNNKQIVNITKFLDRFNIPYLIRRSESILDNRHVKNLILLLKVIDNSQLLTDNSVMWQVLSMDLLGFNSYDVFSLIKESKVQKMTMYDFVQKTNMPKYQDIITFMNRIVAMQQYSMNNTFTNTFTKVIHEFGVIKFLETLDDSYAQINRLSSLYQYVSSRSRSVKEYTISTFLSEVQLMQERNIVLAGDPIDINIENKINLITAHSSKGLEFDHVFVYQCIESKWEKARGGFGGISLPPLSILDEDIDAAIEDLEIEKLADEIDERRLFYVAMTRAKKGLYLTSSKRYFDSDSGEVDATEKMASKFVSESKIGDFVSHADLVEKHTDIMRVVLSEETPIDIPDRNKEYLRKIVDTNLNLSATKLNTYEKCHYRFLLQDVYELPTPKNLNAEIGSAIHKGIELLTKSYDAQTGKPTLTREELYSIAKKELDSNISKDDIDVAELGSIDVAYEEINRGLSAYYDYYQLNPEKPVDQELFLFGTYDGIRLRGRIDKISKGAGEFAEHLVITDYKTTSLMPTVTSFLGLTASGNKNHLRQLMFYRLLMESADTARMKALSSKLTSLKIEYIDTKNGEVKVFELPKEGIFQYLPRANSKKTADFDVDAEYEQFKNDLKQAFADIQNMDFSRTEDRRECQLCPFRNHCGR